ncbi:hypothetical protein ACFL2E_01210 [Thermodesulfobacteriota bacterium]
MAQNNNKNKRLISLFFLGCLLLNYPILSLFNVRTLVLGIPLLCLYVFSVWSALILLISITTRRPRETLRKSDKN